MGGLAVFFVDRGAGLSRGRKEWLKIVDILACEYGWSIKDILGMNIMDVYEMIDIITIRRQQENRG
jgi:hypothetical protein